MGAVALVEPFPIYIYIMRNEMHYLYSSNPREGYQAVPNVPFQSNGTNREWTLKMDETV